MPYKPQPTVPDSDSDEDNDLDLNQIVTTYNQLTQSITRETKQAIEVKKLKLIQQVSHALATALHVANRPTNKKKPKRPPSPTSQVNTTPLWKSLLYYFLLLFGAFQYAATSYLFAESLFGIIPTISPPFVIGLSILYTILDSILFYAFEVSFVKEALGMSFTQSGLSQRIQTYSDQLNEATLLNARLASLSVLKLEDETYNQFSAFTTLINQDLLNKANAIGLYRESSAKKILKIAIYAFSVLSSAAGSYFFASTFLNLWFPLLMGTPFGWTIILLTILTNLFFNFAMNGSSVMNLLNPNVDAYTKLQESFKQFHEEHKTDLDLMKSFKAQSRVRPTNDASTQTERRPPRVTKSLFLPPVATPPESTASSLDSSEEWKSLPSSLP